MRTAGLHFLFLLLLLGYGLRGQSLHAPAFQPPVGVTVADYAPGTVVVRLRKSAASPNARSATGTNLLTSIREICGDARIAPIVTASPAARTATPHPLADIYRIETDETDLPALINRLQQLDAVLYAEPYYLLQPLNTFRPNDPAAHPQRGQQDYLTTVHAYEAWAIEQGRADVIIGMLDTGVELDHPDLADNLHVNAADPINGRDDDGDGYVDNYRGWDLADQDADPSADTDGHGTGVTGVAAATPDNGTGIAGLGFRSSYMPIKVFRSGDGRFAFGYEAIAYAADRGCKVINLSWGGANAYSQFGQDVIDYAVQEKDVVVVAAAGNSGRDERYYPASYDGVLSVAVTDAHDRAVGQTTHNHWVDLVAPGQYSYSTQNGKGYHYGSGSSFAAPLVAGAAALVRAHFPRWSAQQVMQQLRLSADDIYDVEGNAAYHEKLGHGRLNAARALQPRHAPALRATSLAYANHAGAHAYYGDTLALTMTYQNWLSPTANDVNVTLSSPSPYVTLIDSVVHLGVVDSLAQATHRDRPFRVYLHHDLPPNEELVFRVGFSAGDYEDYQYVRIVSSPDYATIDDGNLSLRVNGNGELGSGMSAGFGGLQYQGQSVAPQLGLLIASAPDRVSDSGIERAADGRSRDFATTEAVKFHRSPAGAMLLRSSFADTSAEQPVGVAVQQTWLADTSAGSPSFLVGEYRITNVSDTLRRNLRAGLFTDWSLGEAGHHQAAWDSVYQLGYAYDPAQQRYGGVALLTEQSPSYYAPDHSQAVIDADKYAWLLSGVHSTYGSGAQVVGATLDTLAAGQSAEVALALVTGNSLAALQQAVEAARAYYQRYRRHPLLLPAVPVCTGQTATVRVPGETTVRFYRDPLGAELLTEGKHYETGVILKDTAVYVASVHDGYEAPIRRVPIVIAEPVAQFTVDAASNPGFRNDTLFLDESNNHALRFRDESQHAVAWDWDFGNASGSTLPQPTAHFTEPGRYPVTLTARSEPGCVSQTAHPITVVQRADRPLISDRNVFLGDTVALRASNTNQIDVYGDEALTKLLFSGARFVSDPIAQTTDLWVVNGAGAVPSLPQRVQLRVLSPVKTPDNAADSTQVASVTSPPANQAAKALRLYPNPTVGKVQLANHLWAQQAVHLRLSTLRGQELGRQEGFYGAFPLSVDLHQLAGKSLPTGVYLLHVYGGGRVVVRRVVVRD